MKWVMEKYLDINTSLMWIAVKFPLFAASFYWTGYYVCKDEEFSDIRCQKISTLERDEQQ